MSEYEPGAVIAYHWGYDQTNVDFYRITRRTTSPTGRVMLSLRPLTEHQVDGDGWTGHSIPGEPTGSADIRRKLHTTADGNELGVAVESYGWGRVWDGQPQAWSAYA